MVFILAFITILIFLILDWKKHPKEKLSPAQTPNSPAMNTFMTFARRFLHPGHTWVSFDSNRSGTIGVDDFAQRLIGRLDAVKLPSEGAFIWQGEPLVTLIRGKKSLTQVSPISGQITNINKALAASPKLLNESPYDKGWIAKIIPFNVKTDLNNLMNTTIAECWQDAVRLRLVQWFSPNFGTILQDGGAMVDNISDLVSDTEWISMKQEFFPNTTQTDINHDFTKGVLQ